MLDALVKTLAVEEARLEVTGEVSTLDVETTEDVTGEVSTLEVEATEEVTGEVSTEETEGL